MKDETGSKDFIVRLQELVNGNFKLGLAKDNMEWESVVTRPVNVAAGKPGPQRFFQCQGKTQNP
jgi:hypothetical protein